MQTNTTGTLHDRPRLWKAPATAPYRPACATGKDIIARTLISHVAEPYLQDDRVVIIDCGDEDCGFQSSHANLVGEDGIWAEHAYHVADLLEVAGIGETSAAVAAERLRLADKLDAEVTHMNSLPVRRRSIDTTLGWAQAAEHLRHPTATD